MIPCSPPMMFVIIVGHASFQTAGPSGPSTMERSYLRAAGALGNRTSSDAECETGTTMSVTVRPTTCFRALCK